MTSTSTVEREGDGKVGEKSVGILLMVWWMGGYRGHIAKKKSSNCPSDYIRQDYSTGDELERKRLERKMHLTPKPSNFLIHRHPSLHFLTYSLLCCSCYRHRYCEHLPRLQSPPNRHLPHDPQTSWLLAMAIPMPVPCREACLAFVRASARLDMFAIKRFRHQYTRTVGVEPGMPKSRTRLKGPGQSFSLSRCNITVITDYGAMPAVLAYLSVV